MDLTALLGGAPGGSLNDDFAAVSASGDNVFAEAFGGVTSFLRPDRSRITIKFLFDPEREWGTLAILASVQTDYMESLREALTRFLLEDDQVASKKATMDESLWLNIKRAVPTDVLAEHLKTDNTVLTNYLAALSQRVEKTFNEESLLTEALAARSFRFVYDIAIDAYSGSKKKRKETLTRRFGVLSFFFEATPPGDNTDNTNDAGEGASDATATEQRVTSMNSATAMIADASDMAQELGLDAFRESANVVSDKMLPSTAEELFDDLEKWFNQCISSQAARLERQNNRNPLYQ